MGLPVQDNILSVSPFSDDEESSQALVKSNHGRPLKFSVKGLTEKMTDYVKEQGKKALKSSSSSKKNSKKKNYQLKFVHKPEEKHQDVEKQKEVKSADDNRANEKTIDSKSIGVKGQENHPLHLTISLGRKREKSSADEEERESQRTKKDSLANNTPDKVPKIKSHPTGERPAKVESKSEPVKGPKLVIHFGSKSKNVTSSPTSEVSSYPRQHDLSASNGIYIFFLR